MASKPRSKKLTKRSIDAAQPMEKRYIIWDEELKGFGVRRQIKWDKPQLELRVSDVSAYLASAICRILDMPSAHLLCKFPSKRGCGKLLRVKNVVS